MSLTPLRETQTRSFWDDQLCQSAAAAALLVIFSIISFGCSPAAPQPEVLVNSQLDLSLGVLGDEWIVETNQGAMLVLRSSNPERQGTIEFLVGPEEEGVNLVAAIAAHQQSIEALPNGSYSGGQELAGPMGTAFYSRGRFSESATTIEETRLLSIHPRSSRLVEMVYSYPAGEDSSERVSELIGIFAEVE